MKTWIISDTHGQHDSLKVPIVDTIIHCGDSTNYYDLVNNQIEFNNFIKWFNELPIKNKVLIAGNHDCWATKKYNRDLLKDLGIIYLEQEHYELEGRLLFGSPYSPTFGNWYFMRDRSKMYKCWEHLEKGIDVLITHTPPKTILDLNENQEGKLEFCGDNSLLKKILKIEPKYNVFGHIHSNENIINTGIRQITGCSTIFINASCVTDGRINCGVTSHGQIIEI
jgi:Icc-related predicted phosphoesterase